MFGMTQSFNASEGFATQGAPAEGGKRPRQEEKQTCLPVTVRSIELAIEQRGEQGDGSGPVRFFGAEPGMLLLKGTIEAVVKQTASAEFTLNDATGRIKTRYYATSQERTEMEDIVPGRYVSVFGSLRTAPAVHFAASGVQALEAADEISFHAIEAAHAALRLQGHGGTPAAASPEKPAPVPPDAKAAPLEPPMPRKAQLEGAGLRGAILSFVQSEGSGKPEGVALDSICAHAEPAPRDETSAAVKRLVDHGEIFATVDDQHFLCL